MKRTLSRFLIFIYLISMLSSFAACSTVKGYDLMEDVSANQVPNISDLKTDSPVLTDFGVRLLQESMADNQNTLISPLSVLSALSMTANGADGETLTQMEAVLGLPVDGMNEWLYSFTATLPNEKDYKLTLANSIWFKDDPSFTVEQNFLQKNADYFGAGIYKAPFDDSTRREINQWVEDHTGGMIRDILDEIPEEAVMYLVNALAFDARWQNSYETNQIRDGIFTTEDGLVQNVELMHSTEGLFLEDDLATGFIKYYKDRKYAFAAMLPNEGVSIADYTAGLTGAGLHAMLSDPQSITVYAAVPKFKAEYSVEMSSILEKMGMTDAFDWMRADFSRMGSSTRGNLVINRVLHKTFITIDESGTKAGAATAVEINAERAMEMPEDARTVTLDRPFVYMIIDCETDLPVFIGTMMNMTGG